MDLSPITRIQSYLSSESPWEVSPRGDYQLALKCFTDQNINQGSPSKGNGEPGKRVVLLKLLNPWGYGEYTGPWSDNSSEWEKAKTEDIKRLRLVRDDGEFW